MLAKLTAKNQLTLPKAATLAVGATEYFEVEVRDGAIVLTPVRIQRADSVRTKLAELELTQADIDDAIEWARQRVAEPAATYATGASAKRKSPAPTVSPRKAGKRRP